MKGGECCMSEQSRYTVLNNGVKIPWLGLGTYKVEDGQEVENAVKFALKNGYKSIDTASFYGNEAGIGKALKESEVSREEIFVTTKVWNDMHGYDKTLQSFEESRRKLGLDYIDLFLIHWPVPGKFLDTWKAMEKLYKDGLVRAIGVCNFKEHHLDELFQHCEIKPIVNQVECHPQFSQKELRQYCKNHEIQMEAWAPLMKGVILSNPTIQQIAEKHEKTPAQVVLRWHLQHEVIVIPKSVKEHRIIENGNIFDFTLDQEDMDKIDSLNKDERVGKDPDEFAAQWA